MKAAVEAMVLCWQEEIELALVRHAIRERCDPCKEELRTFLRWGSTVFSDIEGRFIWPDTSRCEEKKVE